MYNTAPPPPYTPAYPSYRPLRANLAALPLPVLFRIVSYTLDQDATPSRWMSDREEERVRRVWAMFRGLRGVCRSFWLVSTSILRSRYHPLYLALIKAGYSSDAYPHDSHPSFFDELSTPLAVEGQGSRGPDNSVYARRSRETGVFDRFIAIKVGDELRAIESALSEDSGAEKEIFARFQPAARIEDLLLTLPTHLISPNPSARPPSTSLPLPQPHLSIVLTPSWCQLYVWAKPYGSRGNGKDMVIEVRRIETLEGTVRMIRDGLEDMGRGITPWGGRVQ